MENKSYRVQHRFWLDISKDDEFALAEQLAEKKAERQYTATLRNALRLYLSLAEGDTSVLNELFPFAQQEKQPNENSGSDGGGASKADITRLERMLASLTSNDVLMRSMQSAAGTGPKPMSVPQFDLPRFDDDDDFTIELQPIKNTDAAQNFIKSMIALQ